ncbi:hypothetical protein KFE25_007405 [Diacronema lutheri]|uniref:Serine aminopeptidase S33 domain-containing protein n=1 Tax=Diacronema lutheri TaxID=2081491 RepID=A0A8J5XUZ9_DIALT|nr:hypothetical protein KFE25_007405 [Diacronema lutheri]
MATPLRVLPTTFSARRCAATLSICWLGSETAVGMGADEPLLVFFAGIDEDCAHNLHLAKLSRAMPRSLCAGIEYTGHGRSSGARGELPADAAHTFIEDLCDCALFVAAQCESARLVLAASLGGLVALLLPTERAQLSARVAGVVALAPAVDAIPSACLARLHCAGDAQRHSPSRRW